MKGIRYNVKSPRRAMASEMNLTLPDNSSSSSSSEEALQKELESFISTLPKCSSELEPELRQYKGFWYGCVLSGVISVERQFHQFVDRPPSVMLVSYPKSGTTWLKALLFAIKTRTQFNYSNPSSTHPLLNSSPHDLVPFLEVYSLNNLLNPISDAASILSTHLPFSLLSQTFKKSNFPIVYVYRDPKDVIVSLWHFANKLRSEKNLPPIDLGEVVTLFCKGHSWYGPYCDHLSEYWDASVHMPSRVLFLNYDELRKDPVPLVKRLAKFLGCPFSVQEEQQGVVAKIIDICRFESLSKLEVNKSHKFVVHEKTNMCFKNSGFFRKGEAGDYKNHMSQMMVERVDSMLEKNLKDFKLN